MQRRPPDPLHSACCPSLPPCRASFLSRPSKRYNRSSISPEIARLLVRVAPIDADIEKYREFSASRNETFYKYYQFSTNRMNKRNRRWNRLTILFVAQSFDVSCHFFLLKSSSFREILQRGIYYKKEDAGRFVLEDSFLYLTGFA